MQKTEMIRARVTPTVKEAAEAIFRQLGLSSTEAITLFYHQVALHRGIPFPLAIPNKTTRKALKEVDARQGLTRYRTLESLKREFD